MSRREQWAQFNRGPAKARVLTLCESAYEHVILHRLGHHCLFVSGVVTHRLLWLASQAASRSGLGWRKLPKRWRRFLFGERGTSAR